MRICIDSQWFQFAKTQVVKQYSHNYEVCDWFNTEMSFPYISCCNDDSRIGYTISIMRDKVDKLNKYNIEWYWLANGCYYVNYFLTLPLMTKLFPEITWYFCKYDFHSCQILIIYHRSHVFQKK